MFLSLLVNKFNEIITCFHLKQHVNFPTHVHGHWLDLLLTKCTSNSIKSVFSQQVFQIISRSYQKLTVVRREIEQGKNIVPKNKQN